MLGKTIHLLIAFVTRVFLLVGNAGCGKTVLINDKLASLNEDWLAVSVPFNFYTTSEMLQSILEKPLEKKAGRNYGPPGSKKIIYFIDDMNMPEVCLLSEDISFLTTFILGRSILYLSTTHTPSSTSRLQTLVRSSKIKFERNPQLSIRQCDESYCRFIYH